MSQKAQRSKLLMDLSEYFRRVGFSGPFQSPDLATLRRLHKLHVMSVPFENLSLHCSEVASMDLLLIWDKIVRRGRGGWCFENGALFLWVLKELGYRTTTLSSRVYSVHRGDYSTFDNHLMGKVHVEGRDFIVDVSFGVSKQIWEPLELEPGREQSQAPGIFRFKKTGDLWTLEKTSRRPKVLNPEFEKSSLIDADRTIPMYRFTLEPRSLEHFSEANEKLQTDPSSLLLNKSMVSLQWENGRKALLGQVLSRITFRPDLDLDLFDMRRVQEEELEKVLMEEFNIRLKNKFRPADRKMLYTL